MQEIGIDISQHLPKHINEYLHEIWDYVITVCDKAKETCPIIRGKVKNRLHIGFEDTTLSLGSDEFITSEFRRIRNEIGKKFETFYSKL